MVKNPLANAEEGHGFDPWSRKVPHAMGQLSPCTSTREATPVRSPSTTTRRACLPKLKKAHEQQRRPSVVKIKKKKKKKALISSRKRRAVCCYKIGARKNMYGAQVTHLGALWYSFARLRMYMDK